MKSSTLEGGESLFEVPDNLHPSSLPLISNVGFVGIVNSPPSVENVQFLPITDGGSVLPGVLQGIPDPSKLSSKQANFTHTFLKSVLTSIDSKDPVVANAWLETLLDVIDLLPKEVIREEILGLAVAKGQSSQDSSRLASCKLLGKISTKFEPYVLKSEVLGVVQCLCQDVSGEVRGSMCMQLAAVARGVGLTTTKSLILPELVDLCSDEEVNVRLAGINTVVQMLPLVDQETRSNTLVPLVKKVCERALRVEDATLPVTAHLLGRICHGLHDDLNKEQKDFFTNFYCTLSKLGLPDAKKADLGLPMPDLVAEVRSGEYEAECRQQCAYNFPAMIVFTGGPVGYRKHLHDTLLSFITDPSLRVRNTLALSFHQVCTLIGNEVGILRESFLNLLRSDNIEVIAALVPNVSHILAAFSHHQVLTQSSQQTEVLDLVGALKQGEESVSKSSSWRVHAEILRQIAALALCLPPDLLFSEVVPLMIHRMHCSRPIPCRQAAARTLLVFLRHMDSKEHRDHINKTLIIEFCEANSCHKRMLFLNVCRMALELLPRESFKKDLFQSLLALHTDRVPNIRLKLVGFLPLLKGILSLPDDKERLQEIETAVGSLLMKESDKDVSALLSVVIGHLDKIEVTESKRGSPEGQEVTSIMRDAVAERRLKERDNTQGYTEGDASPLLLSKKGGSLGSLSSRRTNGPGRIPSYVAAQRRRSNTFAPELPPDEKAVKRNSGYWKQKGLNALDLSALCDEVLLSPEEPTTINWEDIVDGSSEEIEHQDFSLLKDEDVLVNNDFLAMERLSLQEFSSSREREKFRIGKQERATRKGSSERFVENNSRFEKMDADISYQKASLSQQDAKSKFLAEKYSINLKDEGRSRDLTSRQRFWMRTSRPKWRRKVASADTSPEEPRRARYSRGSSIEGGRTCFSDTEDPEMHYEFDGVPSQSFKKSKVSKLPPVSVASTNVIDPAFDEPSPPSPHGMYTWPPQHTRHRHHGSFEEEEDTGEHGQHPKDSEYKDNIYGNCDDPLNQNYENDLNRYGANPRAQEFNSRNPNLGQNQKDAMEEVNFHTKQRQNALDSHKKFNNSEFFDSSSGCGKSSFDKNEEMYKDKNLSRQRQFTFPHKPNISDPFNYHPNRRSMKGINKDEGYSKASLNNVNKDRLSLLLSATPKSSKSYDDDDGQNSSTEEDLYAVHGIPPTMPRREPSSGRASNASSNSRTFFSSFPHEMSEEAYPPFLSYSDNNLSNPYLTELPHIPSDNKADLSYKEIRYHLAAAAAAAEQEWKESRRYDYRDIEYKRRGQSFSGEISPSYVLLDSVEMAPWSTSAAYPIGPLAASWLQHGFHSHARHPYFIPPPLMRNRSLPSHSFPSSLASQSFLSYSPFDNQWPYHSSLRSISSLDPSGDEFLIDAGVRIDEASIRSRIPPPTTMTQQRDFVSALGRHTQSGGSARLSRGPGNVSKIPVVGRNSESLGSPLSSNETAAGDVKTRHRVSQRQARPISGVTSHAPTRISIGGSRGKSLSHENLRASARIGISTSSSAKTSPVSSRPASPTNLTHRVSASSSRVRQSHSGTSKRSRNIGASPSGSRCSSPVGEGESRSRRPGSTASSPSSSRCCSPGEEEPRGHLQRRTTLPTRMNGSVEVQGRASQNPHNSSIPIMGGASRGRGSKLPLPTSKK